MDFLLTLLNLIQQLEQYYWQFVAFSLVISVGIYLTIKSRFLQIRAMLKMGEYFRRIISNSKSNKRGINPIQLIFASTGGMIGVGNVVGVSSAVLIGGPGALVWLWIGVFLGMMVKYSEICLALKTRVANSDNSYDGGLMFYVQKAFKSKLLTGISAFATIIYTVEIYQFTVVVDTIQSNFEFLNRDIIIFGLLGVIMYSTMGGVRRLAQICSVMMPTFIITYLIIGIWIIVNNVGNLSDLLSLIFKGAFSGQSAIGGFAGSTFILTAYNGISRAVYAGDIGIGYDSIVQSESRSIDPKEQGVISIYCLLLNCLICSVSMLLVIITNSWSMPFKYHSDVIPMIFSQYLPYGQYFIAGVLFLAGFTTVISFLTVGFKTSEFISKARGRKIYMLYAFAALYIFSYAPQEKLALLMSLCAGILLTVNLLSIIKLRKDIDF